MQKPRFDPTINYGHILQTVLLVITLGGGIYKYATFESEVRTALAAAAERAKVYQPLVSELQRSQVVQDERIGNLAESVREIRKTNTDLLQSIGGIREDMAAIKAKLQVAR